MNGGVIGVFTRHPTAANLLMVVMIVCGLFALSRLNIQFFPNFGIDWIEVSVEWSGASAEDIDANVVQAIEPEVRFLDGVEKVRSTSVEGIGNVFVEFEPGTDMQAALSDVETAIDQVTTLPEGVGLVWKIEVIDLVRRDGRPKSAIRDNGALQGRISSRRQGRAGEGGNAPHRQKRYDAVS